MLVLTGMGTGMEITSAETDGMGTGLNGDGLGRNLILRGRMGMGRNVHPRAGLYLKL